MKKECPLCKSQASLFFKDKQTYYKCPVCCGVFVDKDELPDSQSEKERYELHSDDPADKGYRKFVSPLTVAIEEDFKGSDKGLDFGAGTSAIIATILHEKNYDIKNYDPYFHNHKELLEQKYDYISSCEVVEHFYNPKKEFTLLKSMLGESAKLYLMTEPYDESINFGLWYYKNDVTHVFFYALKTFQWIQEEFGFLSVKVEGRLIVFST